MPVVVIGASGQVGRALVPRLVERGPEVRAVVRRRDAAEDLRGLGAKVAVDDLSDPEGLGMLFHDAHTVCHLAGGLDAPEDRVEEANLGTVRRTLEGAARAGIRRFLFLSYPGADPHAGNPYLRAKGRAEEEIRASGLEHAVVRSTHVYGPASRWLEETAGAARGAVATVIGTGRQRLAPVFVDDVAAVLAAADDRAAGIGGTYGLQGPDEVTADALVDLLAGRRRRKVHLGVGTAGRLTALAGRRLPRHAIEILAADSLADAPDAAAEFGVAATPLEIGLARSLGGR